MSPEPFQHHDQRRRRPPTHGQSSPPSGDLRQILITNERIAQLGARLESFLWFLLEAATYDRFELLRRPRSELARLDRGVAEDGAEHGRRRRSLERALSAEHLVQNNPEGELI